jgi:DnaJ-domain-containing protein 1
MIKIFDHINRLFSNIGNSNKKEDLARLNNQNNQKAKYIYGLIQNRVANGGERIDLKELLGEKEIYLISYRDISAVVCDSEKFKLIHLSKEEAARYLLKHQQVIERVMQQYSIVPMKLGTFAENREEVEKLIHLGQELLQEIFPQIDRKHEIELAITWSDLKVILQEIGKEKEINEFKTELLGDREKFSFHDKIQIGKMVQSLLDKKRDAVLGKIKDFMGQSFSHFKENMVMDDNMVGNMSFLIDQNRSDRFYELVNQLNDQFKERLNFKCIGPLPPYSFYTLEVNKIKLQEIYWAREKLGLENGVTKAQIKEAYRHAAFLVHPDSNPQAGGMEEQFKEVKQAYEILQEYCLAVEQNNRNEVETLKFDENKEPLNLVKIKE